jgi:hypothetical protein
MTKETWTITFNRPNGASITETKQFIKEALESYGGAFPPSDAFFNSLRPVTSIKRVKK